MMHVQNKETFKTILLRSGMVLCLFLVGCRDKSVDHYDRGIAYAGKGEYDQAISEFTKAIEINPRLADAYYNRAVACDNKGFYDQAISDLTEALAINPEYAGAYNSRAISYYHKGRYDQAWEDVNKAQSLGSQVHPGFLKALRRASGREE